MTHNSIYRITGLIIISTVLLLLAPSASAQDTVVESKAIVNWIPNASAGISAGEVVGASALLTRLEQGVHVELRTIGLVPGHAYTVWWVVFNDPSSCSIPCGAPSFIRADGHVVDADGVALFRGRLIEGDDFEVQSGVGLVDAMTAEIRVVVRSHGPALPGRIDEQTYTMTGGCNPQCIDVQEAIFSAP